MKPYFSSHVLAFPGNGLYGPKQKELKLLATFFQSEKVQEMIWDTLKSIPTNSKTLAKIMSKGNADFDVLMTQLEQSEPMPNEKNMAIVCAIELNDKSHNRHDRKERDREVREFFVMAGIPLYEITQATYYPENIFDELTKHFSSKYIATT